MRHGKVVITPEGSSAEHVAVSRAVAAGKMIRAGEAVFVDADAESVENEIFSKHAQILARLAPGAVLSGISGVRGMPTRLPGPDGRPAFPGWLFSTHVNGSARKRSSLPGLEIRSLPGVGPLEGDQPYLGIFLPSPARQMLENLVPSRLREGPARTMGRSGVERRLAEHLERYGRESLEDLQALARRIAEPLGAMRELPILEEIVDGLLLKRDVAFESADLSTRYRKVDPYDQSCLARLAELTRELSKSSLAPILDPHVDRDRRECVSFIEAYFSNYIEGTKFLPAKARRIVFENEIADGRYKDSHDVLKTYLQVVAFARQASGLATQKDPQTSFPEFVDELRERHSRLMGARPEVRPGMFKEDPNRAGNHVFVLPNLVVGTLREGHAMMTGIENPYQRGLFAHCLSVLVHPFDDGNGRLSRILMNKEIVGGGQCRIVVPTIFRTDYIGAMRALTRPDETSAGPFVRAMSTCRRVTAAIATPDLDRTIERWASTNAFLEDEKEARLEMPSDGEVEWRDGIPAPASYWQAIDHAFEANDFSL